MAYCRLLARDGTPQGVPIVSRKPPPEYILVRRDECEYEELPTRPPVIVLPPPRSALRPEDRDKRDLRDIMALVEQYLAIEGNL